MRWMKKPNLHAEPLLIRCVKGSHLCPASPHPCLMVSLDVPDPRLRAEYNSLCRITRDVHDEIGPAITYRADCRPGEFRPVCPNVGV